MIVCSSTEEVLSVKNYIEIGSFKATFMIAIQRANGDDCFLSLVLHWSI